MLRRRLPISSKRERRMVVLSTVAIIVGLFVVLMPLLGSTAKLGIDLIAQMIVTAAFMAFFGWYFWRVHTHERLILNHAGIRYVTPLPEALAFMQPSWAHSWSEIRSAETIVRPNAAVLMLNTASQQRQLLGYWDPEDGASENSFWGKATRSSVEALAEEVEKSPLVQRLRANGVTVTRRTSSRFFAGFDLESRRATKTVVSVVIVLTMYTIVDLVMNEDGYVGRPPLEFFVLAGLLVAAVTAVTLLRLAVPKMETWALSIVLGAVTGAALYPALLRIQQLTGPLF